MAHTYGAGRARSTALTANPITVPSIAFTPGETVGLIAISVDGSTNRAGGAPSWGEYVFQQVGTVQKAAVSPESSLEIWYMCNMLPGSKTLTIPNTGGLTIRYQIATALAKPGYRSQLDLFVQANGTSTNPSPGTITTTVNGDAVFSACVNGAQTFAPTARAGTSITEADDGNTGFGFQYTMQAVAGAITLNWTFATSEDWGAIAVAFEEVPSIVIQNYLFPKAAGGISVGERTR